MVGTPEPKTAQNAPNLGKRPLRSYLHRTQSSFFNSQPKSKFDFTRHNKGADVWPMGQHQLPYAAVWGSYVYTPEERMLLLWWLHFNLQIIGRASRRLSSHLVRHNYAPPWWIFLARTTALRAQSSPTPSNYLTTIMSLVWIVAEHPPSFIHSALFHPPHHRAADTLLSSTNLTLSNLFIITCEW
jgi:hypothetical protein